MYFLETFAANFNVFFIKFTVKVFIYIYIKKIIIKNTVSIVRNLKLFTIKLSTKRYGAFINK
jgi:hypothetical protein